MSHLVVSILESLVGHTTMLRVALLVGFGALAVWTIRSGFGEWRRHKGYAVIMLGFGVVVSLLAAWLFSAAATRDPVSPAPTIDSAELLKSLNALAAANKEHNAATTRPAELDRGNFLLPVK